MIYLVNEILKTCPRWIESNDNKHPEVIEYKTQFPVIYAGQSRYKIGWSVPNPIDLPDRHLPIPGKLYTGKEEKDILVWKCMGYDEMLIDGEELIFPDTPLRIAHGMIHSKVNEFASPVSVLHQSEEMAHCIQFKVPHGRDAQERFAYVECNVIIPESISDAVAEQLPDAKATTDILYLLYPENLMNHFIDKLGAQERVVVKL